MKHGVDPKVDYAFKKLFGSESTVDLLIDLLNAVLRYPPGKEVASVTLLNPFSDKEAIDDGLAVLDVLARDATGRLFHVEMQIVARAELPQRFLYYWARTYGRQVVERNDYLGLRPTVSICFVSTSLFPDLQRFHHEFQLMDPATGLILTEDIELHILELARFTRTAAELESALDRWCFFLKHAEQLDSEQLPASLDTPPIHRAMEVLGMEFKDDHEWARYESRHKAIMDRNTDMRVARESGVMIGQIQVFQRMLKLPVTSSQELEAVPYKELPKLLEELEKQAFPAEAK